MEEQVDSQHFKRERPSYHQPPPLHMPPAEAVHLHNYHASTPQTPHMAQPWTPAPPSYHDGHDQRQSHSEASQPHQPTSASYAQSQAAYHPHPSQLPHPPPTQTPIYPSDPAYSRHNSSSGPPRSPPSGHSGHYSIPVNGGPPTETYYHPDYRSRPPFPPPESPANAVQQPIAHSQPPAHEMMPAQHPQPGPPPGYPPQPHSAGPHAPAQYWSQPPSDWYMQQKRKPVRAAQACDSCRQRKAKCDEGRPECAHCKENALKCTYRDVAPPKSEKQMLQMGEKVDVLTEKLDSLAGSTDEKFQTLLNFMHSLESRIVEARSMTSVPMAKQRSRPQTKEEARSVSAVNGHHDINAPFINNTNFRQSGDQQSQNAEKSTRDKRGPMGASDLLTFDFIKELVPPEVQPTYVMDLESERGLLRLYGCGEGEDKYDGHDGAPSPAPSTSSGRLDDDASVSSPSGVWGTGQLPQREGNRHPVYDHPGGVTPSGELLLDSTAVDKYVKSYLDHMHILHPFLDPKVLRKMVTTFKYKYSFDYRPAGARLSHSISAGIKRKRETSESPNSMPEEPTLHSVPHHSNGVKPSGLISPLIEHSISNAIILLVIALGKICSYHRALPGPPKSSSFQSKARVATVPQPLLGHGDFPPPNVQPPSSSAPASPHNITSVNGFAATQAVSTLHGKNMDVIPGLAYFAKAADILGELRGGIDVSHIQANLLAGLYMGQLARILSSLAYISDACKACQVLIQTADYKEKKMPPSRRNLINFAFWSCLQLESDILAEVPIPPSGITNKEAAMMFEIPTALTIEDPEKEKEESSKNDANDFLIHYSNQIQLRRTLNDAVHNIYTVDRDDEKPVRLIETIGENLENWRRLLKEMDWSDEEHESTDINQARMRAKYYGARYIINRPALLYALKVAHRDASTPLSHPSESPLGGGYNSGHTSPALNHSNSSFNGRKYTDMRPPPRSVDQMEPWVTEACYRCVSAAIKSTTAFDSVRGGRLIITNILGTAHAQFGNVLVLAATYNSPDLKLRAMVPEEDLRYLFGRTIKFLEQHAAISPALAKDASILRWSQRKLFPGTNNTVNNPNPNPVSANSSFTSAR